MKQITKSKLPALVLAICLIISNVTMTFADVPLVQTQAPTLTAIDKEITTTAEYLKASASINATSDFYNSSKLLILLLRSGINCSSLVDSYLSQISTAYISNGELTLADPLTDYAYLAMILTLAGKDATNFNKINVITKFETAITNADQSTLNNINPYKLAHLYTAAYAYTKEFKDSAACLTKIKIAILSYANENGIDYWGNSADNNGFALSGLSILSNSDSNMKKLVENALTFSQTLLQADGTSNGDFQWSQFSNSDSTAGSLTLYSTYSQPDLAAKSYAGLLTFKNSAQAGAYSYTSATDVVSSYSTIDAFYSLVSYRAVLANQSAPFDVSDKLASLLLPSNQTETESETEAETAPITSGVVIDATLAVETASTIESTSTVETAIDISKKSPTTSDSNIMTIIFLISLMSSCGIITIMYMQTIQRKHKNS